MKVTSQDSAINKLECCSPDLGIGLDFPQLPLLATQAGVQCSFLPSSTPLIISREHSKVTKAAH